MDVFIAGISHTKLGRHVQQSVKDLTREAVTGALLDAGVAQDAVGAAWFSNVRQGQMEAHSRSVCSDGHGVWRTAHFQRGKRLCQQQLGGVSGLRSP